jgi:hypothetical protein
MNEKLKEIAIKAQVEHCISHVRLKEFADLIVKECLAKAEEEAELYRGFSHLGGAEYAKVMYNYQLLLKEHFGVDE